MLTVISRVTSRAFFLILLFLFVVHHIENIPFHHQVRGSQLLRVFVAEGRTYFQRGGTYSF